MYIIGLQGTDARTLMNLYVSWEAASKENKWQGRNITRWRNEEYDGMFRAAESELDPVKRAALFIQMNDLVVKDPAVIPVVYRPRVSAVSHWLKASFSGWDNDMWDLRNWYKEA